ncbi:glycosyltransferase family 2 protein [Aurantimonas coralicida]|uniref:glycosyltransferase family 2 protein n=1 Tax=Aurantimonas coralicida TaxID=182270 RepID=UPI0006851049|nr:glycosyltransferase [Aurantimonas coralicida]MCC4300126.1 glycosyltransferase [Aurantimonas coralicida]MCW7546230.1 glycosyltransferase [Aurantimonas litoralis]
MIRATIGIASAGRPQTLGDTIVYLASILDPGDRIVVCVPAWEDAGDMSGCPDVHVVVGPRGLTRQRNQIIADALDAQSDFLVFLDDDFTPAPDYVRRMKAAFAADETAVIATGHVVADGILGEPIAFSDSLAIIYQADRNSCLIQPVYNAYGCNMAIRLQPVKEHSLAFDEELPLYGWLEDVDFSRALAAHGRCLKVAGAVGVHLGVRSGRQPGLRLGYSQIANPSRLIAKGTMSTPRALAQMGRNVLANIFGSLRGDAQIDRRGRLKGNLSALADVVRFRVSPGRILDMEGSSRRSATALSPVKRG